MYSTFMIKSMAIVSIPIFLWVNSANTDIHFNDIKNNVNLSVVQNPILKYKNIEVDLLALGFKAQPVNFIEAGNVLQMGYYDPTNKITTVSVQINNIDNHNCFPYYSFTEFDNTHKETESSHENSYQFDYKNSELKIGDKSVYINLCHYKYKTTTKNYYKAVYMESKYLVTIDISGKLNSLTDTYEIEQSIGKQILEATLKIKPNTIAKK